MNKHLVAIAGLILTAGAYADTKVPVGIDIGIFFPSGSSVRSTFGDTWVRVGLSPLSFQVPENWKFTFDIAYLHRSGSGQSVTVIPITVGATQSFVLSEDARTYVALRGGPYWAKVDSSVLGVDSQGFGFNANAAVGIVFRQSFYIEARYDKFSDFSGLDLSGFHIAAGFKLFEIRM